MVWSDVLLSLHLLGPTGAQEGPRMLSLSTPRGREWPGGGPLAHHSAALSVIPSFFPSTNIVTPESAALPPPAPLGGGFGLQISL